MRKEEFRKWLENGCGNRKKSLSTPVISDALSRCLRIEKARNVNLDQEYLRDGGKSILDILKYSAEDARTHKLPPEGFEFSSNASIKAGLASLKNAATRYFEFCEDCKPNTFENEPTSKDTEKQNKQYKSKVSIIQKIRNIFQ